MSNQDTRTPQERAAGKKLVDDFIARRNVEVAARPNPLAPSPSTPPTPPATERQEGERLLDAFLRRRYGRAAAPGREAERR